MQGPVPKLWTRLIRSAFGALALLLGAAAPALAANCSDFPYLGVIDGNFVAAPSQIQIDTNCTIRNFPSPYILSTNFSFYTQPGGTDERWLVVFDNVVHTGNMACNSVAGHRIWFTNGSSTKIQEGCQNLLIPVEKIDKQNPAGRPTATIGVPFTYKLTIPVLYDPALGVIMNSSGSPNTLHGITVWDDLNAMGADLAYVEHVAYWQGTDALLPHAFSNADGLLTFEFPSGFVIPAGGQIIIEITVVLRDTPANAPGTQFVNTAKWAFGRLIDDVFYQPLPGEWGVSDPMTIVDPNLVVRKTSEESTVRPGVLATFSIDVQNIGVSTAWNASIVDNIPAGMCDHDPTTAPGISAQVFAADGVTPVSSPLVEGTDFSVAFSGAPTCQLRLSMDSAAAVMEPSQRLILRYQSQINADTIDGTTLTNIAGATRWFNGASTVSGRRQYDRGPLTDGTPGLLDFQDSATVTAAVSGYLFEKTVQDRTSGQNPAATAAPGDRLRFRLRLFNVGQTIDEIAITDLLDPTSFVPTSFTMVIPPQGGATYTYDTGTGLLTISGSGAPLSLAPGDELVVEFEIDLKSALSNGAAVRNRAILTATGTSGNSNETSTLIRSAPKFAVWKTSRDLSGDPAELMAGDQLRYAITVKNVGNEDAVAAVLQDQIPAHTRYLPGTTTLNGAPVTDPGPGVSPLQDGMPINGPENGTAGYLRAGASDATGNVATVTFDVQVNDNVVAGTVISNQGLVKASGTGSGPTPEQPSEDPDTGVVDDPTHDVVGKVPLVDAWKTVELLDDRGSAGIVDPGDVLRYTIRVSNTGAAPATGVVLTDAVPEHTTYLAGSLRLNGLPVGQPDGGISPLAGGIAVSSADLTPPLPTAGDGALSVGSEAVVTFDVRVNDRVAPGTIISNQGTVSCAEQVDEPTDADGIDANGDQPTRVVVGFAQQLSLLKEVYVVGGGPALPGSQLEYVLRATNNGGLPASNVVLTDDLGPLAGRATYVAGSASLNGSAAGVALAGAVLSADYSAPYGDLPVAAGVVVRFRVQIEPSVTSGTTLTNTAVVSWNDPAQTERASVSVDVGGTPGSASLNGSIWHDVNLNGSADDGERRLQDWSVDLYRDSGLLATVLTDADGRYRLSGLAPNAEADAPYELRFRAPGATANTPSLGTADSPFRNGPQRISEIRVLSGSNLQALNLPITPNGAVYDAVARTPISGAELALRNAITGTPLPNRCFDDPRQQEQLTTQDGFYKFDLNFSDPACPPGGAFLIHVTPRGTGYETTPSRIIPPASDATTPPFSVPACPGSSADAVPTTAGHCEATTSALPPAQAVPPRTAGTTYYLNLTLSNGSVPGQSQIFNNPIPIDPVLDGTVSITKTAAKLQVSRAELVPYTITVRNLFGVPLQNLSLVDRFPAGFKYVADSARLDGEPWEPMVDGLVLTWDDLTLQTDQRRTLQLLLVVGSGASENEYVNRAQVRNALTGARVSEEATATVRVVPDPNFDCTDVIGKVFDDRNLNGHQDEGEPGLSGVRLVTARGLIANTDRYGRFHLACAAVPDAERGSNFILKLDDRTLPSGYRVTTENPRVQRATRGKMLRFNFGATIHRVVTLDVADAAYEPGTTDLRPQWQGKLEQLLPLLKEAPSVLRLSYLADVEAEGLVQRRLKMLKREISGRWERSGRRDRLDIETEVFWRRGSPP